MCSIFFFYLLFWFSSATTPFSRSLSLSVHQSTHTNTNPASVILVRVESLQLLQEDVAAGDRVVLVGHDEKLEDGPSAGAQEQHGPVPVRPSLRVHDDLIQLVPVEHSRLHSFLTLKASTIFSDPPTIQVG